jgi:hypothetical protein
MRRDDLGFGYTWATDHLTYVGTLWDEVRLKRRMEGLMEVASSAPGTDESSSSDKRIKVVFRKCVYRISSPSAY